MNIEDKLRKSKQTHAIYFFREGVFARLYNESLFMAIEFLQLDVKVNIKQYKKLNNQRVLKGGLPINQLLKQYPQLLQYNWGYKLECEFIVNSEDYKVWCNQKLPDLLINNTANELTRNALQRVK